MKAENWLLQITVAEAILGLLFLLLVAGVAGLGAGFYLGTHLCQIKQEATDHTGEVLELCKQAMVNEADRGDAWKTNNSVCQRELERYRAWIVDVEDKAGVKSTVSHKPVGGGQ